MRKFEDKYLVRRNFDSEIENIYITPECIKGSVMHCYNTLDIIDRNLTAARTQKISFLIEHANLSSIVGNLLGTGYVLNSHGLYSRNKPHTYPDLVSSNLNCPGIEIKTSIRKNPPKGHQPKPGYYLTYRYCLTNENGEICTKEGDIADTVTIWEIKFGYLEAQDFSCSNTLADSGKTASIKISSLNQMKLLYLDTAVMPYKHSSNNPYKGFN